MKWLKQVLATAAGYGMFCRYRALKERRWVVLVQVVGNGMSAID